MKTDEEIYSLMDKAEKEIATVLKKYNLAIGMMYTDGGSVVLCHCQTHETGDYSFREREVSI